MSTRASSLLPLLMAGGALILAAWLVVDQTQPFGRKHEARRPVSKVGTLADFEKAATEIFEASNNAVAHVVVGPNATPYMPEFTPEGSGSGILWTDTGLVVTNFHVIQKARDRTNYAVFVEVAENWSRARVVATARELDIAVLELEDVPVGVSPIPLGTSANLRVGQAVFAIGNPFGLTRSLSTGVIGSLNRPVTLANEASISNAIQVDASINPGNSGGPLLDSSGQLIGMNTAIYSPTKASAGIGFAVPIDTIRETVEELVSGTRKDWQLGITGTAKEFRPLLGYQRGILVATVQQESPAALAGMHGNELNRKLVIVEVDGVRTGDMSQVQRQLARREPGEVIVRTIAIDSRNQARLLDYSVRLR